MEITSQQALTWLAVTLVLCNIFSTLYTARKNAKALKAEHDAPLRALEERMAKVEVKLSNDYIRFQEEERELMTMKSGLTVICQGVLALLNHELHNGNADEMQDALKGLNAWMLGR